MKRILTVLSIITLVATLALLGTISVSAGSIVSRDDGIWLFPLSSGYYNSFSDWAGCNQNSPCSLCGGYSCSVWGDSAHAGNPYGHNGIDISTGGAAADIMASAPGVVRDVVSSNAGARGRYVVIEHTIPGNDYSYYSYYQHCSSVHVSVGDTVSAGQVIANVGGSGLGSDAGYGYHLHFGILLGPCNYAYGLDAMDWSTSTCTGWILTPGNRIGRILTNPSVNSPAGLPTGSDWGGAVVAPLNAHCGSVSYTFDASQVNVGISAHNPFGYFDSVEDNGGAIHIRGWAFDADDYSQSCTIHVYIGGPDVNSGEPHNVGVADAYRPDVNNVFPGSGEYHGFDTVINTDRRGTQEVYVYALNTAGGGDNVLLGTLTVDITNPIETAPRATETRALETTTPKPTSISPSEPDEILYGDATGDSVVNMKDVLTERKYVAGMVVTIDCVSGDCNGDGAVNMKDILIIRKYLAGLIDEITGDSRMESGNNGNDPEEAFDEAAFLSDAREAIDYYVYYRNMRNCCERGNEVASLTDSRFDGVDAERRQRWINHGYEYVTKFTCCSTVEEARAHAQRYLSANAFDEEAFDENADHLFEGSDGLYTITGGKGTWPCGFFEESYVMDTSDPTRPAAFCYGDGVGCLVDGYFEFVKEDGRYKIDDVRLEDTDMNARFAALADEIGTHYTDIPSDMFGVYSVDMSAARLYTENGWVQYALEVELQYTMDPDIAQAYLDNGWGSAVHPDHSVGTLVIDLSSGLITPQWENDYERPMDSWYASVTW